MGPRSHGEGLEMPRPASPSSPTGPLRAACLLPHDSAPLPSSAGLLPPALSSSLLFGSLRGLPATPAQDAGSQGLQGPGPVPQQDWHSGPVPGHAARVRAGSPGARLPLHAVLSHAIPVPEAGPGLCCLRLPADHLWRASAVGRARVWQRSTCSWLSPAARPCPACPYSLPRACPAPSCTRCQVGPAAQMAITDLSAPEERPAALGRLGLCFGVGVIFGSLLGGTLSSTCGIQCPVIVALVVSLLGAVLSFTCIPTSTKGASARAQAALPGKPKASVFDLKAITCLLLQPGVLPVFLVKVICGFPSAVAWGGPARDNLGEGSRWSSLSRSPRPSPWHRDGHLTGGAGVGTTAQPRPLTPDPPPRPGLFMVMFSLISMDFFQLEAAQAGYLMSFFGVLQMVFQGLVIGWLSSRFSEGALLRASVLAFSVVGLAMALMANVFHLCLLMPGLVFSLCALNVVTDSMLTNAVSASDTGTMLGLCASVQPLTRTLGPTLGGLLYHRFGVPVFGHVQLAVNFLVLLVLWRQPVPPKMDKAW
ncbi:solute carrier family 22 member 18 isoform X6 [Sagmatias obliquidens]|uniref:solute carrier family 22 member 18 isoform X6 n=1 Tax=Sagmatias obliquidens TaxID=3371155 RepID=UPI000F4453F5|nr:solute carrier family 22 member 18 isoform X6 [Lagenorhynchus obliquidens]